jgi:dipeptidyl aminopeptidase/acylaminoacyl peptidase
LKFTRKAIALAAITLGQLMFNTSATAETRGLQIEDLVNMERVAAPAISPDGTRVVYQIRSTDLDKNRGRTDLWMQDLRNPAAPAIRLTNSAQGEGNNQSPSWSASGDAVYFISTRSGSAQVWRTSLVDGAVGTSSKVTDLPLDVESYKLAPGGDLIALSIAVFRDCPDLACSKQKLDDKEKSKASGKQYEQLFVRHWDSWADGRRNVLFSAALDAKHAISGAPMSISGALDADVHSKPDGDQNDYDFSPDGKTLVFSARVAGKQEAWSTNFDLYLSPSDGSGAARNLTADNPAWDAKPSFSPDGKTLAYLAMKRPGFETDRFQIVLLDVASGKKRLIAEKWDHSAGELQWADDGKSLYTMTADVGQTRVFKITLGDSTKQQTITALTGAGVVADFHVRADQIVMTQAQLTSAPQLYQAKLNTLQWQPLTHLNAERLADVRLGTSEQFSFTGAKGDKVYGYVVKPWNAKPGEKYPVAFLVHGGPQGSFNNGWSYRWNPQIYAGAGYAVVMVDFHGSVGYGQTFTDSISGDWGGKPLEDLQKGLAAASKQFNWIDPKNACALGASYGGYMMNWVAGKWPDGFKCIVNHAGVFDTRAMAYSSEELWFNEWEYGGTYYNASASHEKVNPVNFVKNWKTPMLVTQGERDFRIPSMQSLSAFTALQRRGIESQLLIFPDENHHILKPANSLQWHHAVLDWLGKYLH